MGIIDYEKMGFKCGMEIHAQLDVGKLFCRCPSIVRDKNKPDVRFQRKLRAVIGETGEIDKAAAYEMSKGKYYLYEGCSTSCCLVDMDEEPPGEINSEALKGAVMVAGLLHCELVDEIQIMRKTVVDGSNVSGFQRTALVGMNGYIETSKGRVNIPTVLVEEEAAQKIETKDDCVIFRLDRLGVPLLEISTDASIKDADHAKEIAENIGMIVKSTGKAKRGIGTIRQDVNVSIEGGHRVEIKGFQDVRSIKKVIEYEIKRQRKEMQEGKTVESHVRKAEGDFTTSFLRPMPGAARMYPETDTVPIVIDESFLKEVDEIELISDKEEKYIKEFKISKDLANKIAKSEHNILFESLVAKCKNVKPAFIGEMLISYEPELNRNYKKADPELIKERHLVEVIDALDKGNIAKESIIPLLVEVGEGNELDLTKYKLMDDAEVETILKEIVKENKDAPFNTLIGKAMGKLRGKADGKKIVSLLKKLT